jgi:hypothetical protein
MRWCVWGVGWLFDFRIFDGDTCVTNKFSSAISAFYRNNISAAKPAKTILSFSSDPASSKSRGLLQPWRPWHVSETITFTENASRLDCGDGGNGDLMGSFLPLHSLNSRAGTSINGLPIAPYAALQDRRVPEQSSPLQFNFDFLNRLCMNSCPLNPSLHSSSLAPNTSPVHSQAQQGEA